MVFSSTVFVFQFLPVCLLVYFATFAAARTARAANVALIALSLAFYFIGNGALVLLLVGSIIVNHALGRRIAMSHGATQRAYVALGIAANLALLFYFKYGGFFVQSVIDAGRAAGWTAPFHAVAVALPVGISFYTFMSMSYLIDVSRERRPAESIWDFAVYLSLFPHLVAGPIVRFGELRAAIAARTITSGLFVDGMYRFSIGLARKAIIADTLAVQADRVFALAPAQLTAALAWTGALCYAFQIFFDFSGYTDMAIGLAKMLGFNFPENFAQPYTAATVTEFWRRWHMTLTRWFRDYLYVPLGGNRRGGLRTYANLFIVFFLCGLWHGAAWTFVAWGMYHGALLVIERALRNAARFEMRGVPGVLVTFALVTVGWVFFRSASIAGALAYLGVMFGAVRPAVATSLALGDVLTPSTIAYLAVAAIFAFIPLGFADVRRLARWPVAAKGAIAVAAFIVGIAYVSETTFRPFIYFRF